MMILLARHGQTAWNALGRMQGHTDVELDATGRAQAAALAGDLAGAGIARVWSSDLRRASETAAIVAAALGLAAPTVDVELRERSFGVFEGLTRDEIAAQHPDAWRAWTAERQHPPGGESTPDAIARLGRAIARVHLAGGPALVISHGGVMRLWLGEITGAQLPLIPNTATYRVAHDGARFHAELRAR